MEGYHIKALHGETFYPYGYDNLNVVETFGPNSRITFPFNRIEKLRAMPTDQRRIDGLATYVYQLFPNARISMQSSHSRFIVIEPISLSHSRWIIYRLGNRPGNGKNAGDKLEEAKRDAAFVIDTGLAEDRHATCTIQAGLSSQANDVFSFGHFEQGITHFHGHLTSMLAKFR